jgi:hypothetical protein
MGQGESEKIKIPSWVLRRLEKRESLVKEQDEELNRTQSEGRVSRRDSARISRRAVSIESIDRQMYRSGFIPPQTATPTSRTTQIAPSMMAFDSTSGFNISPRRGGGSGGGTAATGHPFKIKFSGSGKITVDGGSINSIIPSNLFTGLNQTEFSLGSGLNYVILTATALGEKITSATISISNSSPSPQDPVPFGLPTSMGFTLGVASTQSIYQVTYNNISITGRQHYIADKQGALDIGELPYTIYYIWG